MRRLRRVAALLSAATLAASPATAADACGQQAEAVRAAETGWLATYRSRDARAMGEFLARDFAITHTDGSVETGRQVLEGIERRKGSEGPEYFTTEVAARCRRGLVVLTGWVARRGSEERSRARYTDTWVREGGRWRVLSSHLSRPPRPASPH